MTQDAPDTAEEGRLNLPGLREVAEKATPGPWVRSEDGVSQDEVGGWCSIADCRNLWRYSGNRGSGGYAQQEANAEFIAAFDPPTVLALLSSAEAREEAERKAKRYFDEFWDVENERRAVCMAVEHHSNSGTPVSYVVRKRLAEAETALQAAETRAQQVEARVEDAYREGYRAGSFDGQNLRYAPDDAWRVSSSRQALGASHG